MSISSSINSPHESYISPKIPRKYWDPEINDTCKSQPLLRLLTVEAQVQSQGSSSAILIGARFHLFPLALPTFFITSVLHIYINIYLFTTYSLRHWQCY